MLIQKNVPANLDGDGEKTMFFIIEEAKKTILDFPRRIAKVF